MLREFLSGVRRAIRERLGLSNRAGTDDGSNGGARPRTGDAAANHATGIDQLVEQAPLSKREIRMATGLQPNEFLVEVIHHNGGQIWQGDLADAVGWSSSTMSRALNELESEGAVERRQFGRRKRVFLPEAKPESLSDSRFERAGGPGSDASSPRDRESA